jgi:hypothetical protein
MSSWKLVVPRPPFSFYPAARVLRYGYDAFFLRARLWPYARRRLLTLHNATCRATKATTSTEKQRNTE